MNSVSRSSEQLLALQYKLAIHIGKDNELSPMLKDFFDYSLHALNCNGGYVWIRKASQAAKTRYCFPNDVDTKDFVPFIEKEISATEKMNWCGIRSGYAFECKEEFIHIFRLGSIGILALKRIEPLKKNIVAALLPIFEHLATSCSNCIQYESKVLQQKSTVRALQDSIRDLDFKDSIIGSLSKKILTPVEEVFSLKAKSIENGNKNKFDFLSMLSSGIHLVAEEINQYINTQEQLLTVVKTDFVLRDVIEQILASFSAITKLKNLEVSYFVDESIPDYFQGDLEKIRMVLMQLIDNAVRNTENGSVRLSVSGKDINASEVQLKFEVSDTGVGIVKDKLQKLMSAGKDVVQGNSDVHHSCAGIRLAIVQKLLETMSSKLVAESVLGVGSSFCFDLNLVVLESKQEIEINIPANDLSLGPDKKLALIAEDNSVNQMVAVKMLEKLGYDVLTAENGVDAIKQWEEKKPDIVLMDIDMPVMDGMHATHCIREQEKKLGVHVPLVALISNMDKKLQDKCLAAGVDYFLSKPFTPKILDDAIAHARALALAAKPRLNVS